jgi:hypothetical protein
MDAAENMILLGVAAETLPSIPLLGYNVMYGIVRTGFKTSKQF